MTERTKRWKTCKNGHSLFGYNVIVRIRNGKTERSCRACYNDWHRLRYQNNEAYKSKKTDSRNRRRKKGEAMSETPTIAYAARSGASYAGDMSPFAVLGDDAFLNAVRDQEWQRRTRPKDFNVTKPAPLVVPPHLIGEVMSGRRIVQVIISDPDLKVPLEDCVLYKGEEKVTDSTDQELFFELDMKAMLEKHNEKRVKIIDKSIKDRTVFLEPAKIRELKMTVVKVADI